MSGFRSLLVTAVLTLAAAVAGAPSAHGGSLSIEWMAPTTSADNSALSDLATYRIYLGTGQPACPGASFHTVSSPTATPATGTMVASRIVGLSAGTTYFARVTAVDTSGNESACSTSASGAAQADFSVTPTSTTSFGSITPGTATERTFTVQNTGSASISTSVSAGAPFTIVSGGSFTLTAGATRTVTVRFAPTAAGSFAGNVSFTASGDTVSRAVSGTATATAVTLTVTRNGTGAGTVTSSPAGIACGSDCTETVSPGTQLTLTATPVAGSTFAGWTGACSGTGACTVTLSAAHAVTATFNPAPPPLALTVTTMGTGDGTVTSLPAGIACGTACAKTMTPGTQVTLTASPSSSSSFAGWSGACTGTAATCSWTMSAATAVTATFETARVDRPLRRAPVPRATALSPASAEAGSETLALTVNGTGFVPGSLVRWNGATRTTTFIGATRLQAAITAADLATPKSVQVSVVTPAPGGGTSRSVKFAIRAAPVPPAPIIGGEITIDNAWPGVQDSAGGRTFTGRWCLAPTRTAFGLTSLYACGRGVDTYRWTPRIPASGVYDVHVWIPTSRLFSTRVPFVVAHAGGTTMRTLDQRSGTGRWVVHGRYRFDAGLAGYIETSSGQAGAEGGTAGADAVRFVRRQ